MPIMAFLWAVAFAQPHHPDPVIRGALELLRAIRRSPGDPYSRGDNSAARGLSECGSMVYDRWATHQMYVAAYSDAYRYAELHCFNP